MTPEQWAQMTPQQQTAHVAQYGPPPPHYLASPVAVQAPPPPQKRRRVWPWVLLAIVLVPVLVFAGCAALIGGAAKSIDDARQGGTVKIGETFTYASGLALTAAPLTPYDAGNEYIIDPKTESGYESIVTVVNGTDRPVGAVLVTMNATVGGSTPVERVFTDGAIGTQDIAPGQKLAIPFRFKVKKGTTGPLQIAIAGDLNEPVFFTGTL